MKVAEKPMTSIGNLGSGNIIGVTTKKNSQILDVFSRDDNVIMSILEEGDITVVRTFMVVSPYTNIDHLQKNLSGSLQGCKHNNRVTGLLQMDIIL
jgi:hypothetical protein